MAYRGGYIQALEDLYRDGILSAEEFKKREEAQMVSNFSPEIKKIYFYLYLIIFDVFN
jgi:hypothetical protein